MPNPVLIYAPANPIWLLPKVTSDPRVYEKPFDLLDDTCYFQKFIEDDVTQIQILVDPITIVGGFTLKIYDVFTDALVHTFTPTNTLKTTTYNTTSYQVWEVNVAFSGIAANKYYIELKYNDGTQDQILQGPIEVGDFPNTLLIQYRNSINKFSIIFDTNILFELRVEGIIKDYMPQFDDISYNDEIHEQSLLDSVYFDQFKLWCPGLEGYIPGYMAKRVNIAMSCDTVLINKVQYARLEGSKWDVQHAPEDSRIGISIDIVPTDNNSNVDLVTDPNAITGNYQDVRRSREYLLQGDDFAISGVFKAMTDLDTIIVFNTNNIAFTIKIGTTVGGNELGEFPIGTADDYELSIGAPFKTDETVYISGLTGVVGLSCDIYVVYDVLNAPIITLPYSAADTLGKGATMRYKEIMPGDLPMAFDLTSGLGIAGSKWEKWALADGRNGGADESSCIAVMYDPANSDYNAAKLETTGGDADGKIVLTTGQLPNFYLKMFDDSVGGSLTDVPNDTQYVARALAAGSAAAGYIAVRGTNGSGVNMHGRTSSIGNGDQVDVRQKYIVGLTIIKIAD